MDEKPRVTSVCGHAHRRRGTGASCSPKTFDIFYGNVTSMSNKAKQYLATVKDDMWLAGETHITLGATTQACKEWALGWDITAAPASNSATSQRGTYGGVMVAARKQICTQPTDADISLA